MNPRADLSALNDDTLALLATPSLVRRARADLAEAPPTLALLDDHTLHATWPDGHISTIPPGGPLHAARCTCPAAGACRHRVGAILAWHEAHPASPPSPPADDDTLAALVGPRAFAAARRAAARSPVVEVVPAGPASVRLPTTTVRLAVPSAPGWSACDCRDLPPCVHVVLAVWALRQAPDGGAIVLTPPTASAQGRRPLDPKPATAAVTPPTHDGALHAATTLLRRVLVEGLLTQQEPFAVACDAVTHDLHRAGHRWPAVHTAALLTAHADWTARRAAFDPDDALHAVAGLLARVRAREHTPLGDRWLLGADTLSETPVSRLHLTGLGLRVAGDRDHLTATVFFATDDGGTVALRRTWRAPPSDVGATPVLRDVSLRALASGGLLTGAATRLADGQLRLGRALHSALPPIDDLPELAAPPADVPALLQPPLATRRLRVRRVTEVIDLARDPARQALIATLRDEAGAPFLVVERYLSAAPEALRVLGAVAQGDVGPLRAVAGLHQLTPWGPALTPTLLLADRPVLPAVDRTPPSAAPAGVPPRAPTDAWLDALHALLAEGMLHGITHPSVLQDARALADRHPGLDGLHRRLTDWIHEPTPEHWVDLAIRAHLVADP